MKDDNIVIKGEEYKLYDGCAFPVEEHAWGMLIAVRPVHKRTGWICEGCHTTCIRLSGPNDGDQASCPSDCVMGWKQYQGLWRPFYGTYEKHSGKVKI